MLAFKEGREYSVAGQLTFSRLRHMLVTAKPLLCPSSILSPSPVYTRKTTESFIIYSVIKSLNSYEIEN